MLIMAVTVFFFLVSNQSLRLKMVNAMTIAVLIEKMQIFIKTDIFEIST